MLGPEASLLQEFADFCAQAEPAWGDVRSSSPAPLAALTVLVAPPDWARLAAEAQHPATDPYVDPHVEDPELILHLPIAGTWRRQLRVFVIACQPFPEDLWVADEVESWPPNLEQLFADVVEEWDWWHESAEAVDDSEEDAVELPPVPPRTYPPHSYRGRVRDAWLSGTEPGSIARRRGSSLDPQIPALWAEARRAGVSPDDADSFVYEKLADDEPRLL